MPSYRVRLYEFSSRSVTHEIEAPTASEAKHIAKSHAQDADESTEVSRGEASLDRVQVYETEEIGVISGGSRREKGES